LTSRLKFGLKSETSFRLGGPTPPLLATPLLQKDYSWKNTGIETRRVGVR